MLLFAVFKVIFGIDVTVCIHLWVRLRSCFLIFYNFFLKFQPELVLVSCGFDAGIGDPEVCSEMIEHLNE